MLMQLKLLEFTVVQQKMKSYNEAMRYSTYEERLEYLKVYSQVGYETFGYDRYLNQALYKCPEWKSIRQQVIMRDKGCDLAVDGYEIPSHAIVHHINPITLEDVKERNPKVFDLNNLILVSHRTHNAIHYGSKGESPIATVIERKMNDTIPWR